MASLSKLLGPVLRRTWHVLLGARPPPVGAASAVYIGDHTLLVRTIHQDWIYLDSRDTSLTPVVSLTGDWEPSISKLFARTIQPGMSVVDIGCNCGFYTMIAARAVGEKGRVISIDANPRMVELTRRAIAANGMMYRARVIHAAVVDVPGPVVIGVPDELMGSGSLLIRDGEHEMQVTTIKAQGDRLEAFLNGHRRVDVLKIDAEGAEPLILRGAEDVIRDNPDIKIFMEFAPPMQRHFEPAADFLARLRGYGLRIFEILKTGEVVERRDEELLERTWAELLLHR